MRIIKKGKKKCIDYIEYITKCESCGCKFTYTEDDFRTHENIARIQWLVIRCPHCNKHHTVNSYRGVEYKKHYKTIEN